MKQVISTMGLGVRERQEPPCAGEKVGKLGGSILEVLVLLLKNRSCQGTGGSELG